MTRTAAIRVESVSPILLRRESGPVVWADSFDQPVDLRRRYFEYDDARGSFVWDGAGGYGGRGGAMRCTFAPGQVGAGSLKVAFGRNPAAGNRAVQPKATFREIYWRIYVKHADGWQGNPAKLARATCLAGSDWSQGLIAHVWGGKNNALCIDPATGISDNRKVTTRYNDFAHLRWLGLQHARTPIFAPEESGRWVCIESRVRLNTPGRRDGVFELWIEGRREAARTDLDWQGTWNEYGINAVFFENYWNDGSVKRQSRWFDNIVISTAPIGPIVVPGRPTIRRTGKPVAGWQAQAAADPEGQRIVWTGSPLPGRLMEVPAAPLKPDRVYWLRLRERHRDGSWSQWTAWHAPFRTAPK